MFSKMFKSPKYTYWCDTEQFKTSITQTEFKSNEHYTRLL